MDNTNIYIWLSRCIRGNRLKCFDIKIPIIVAIISPITMKKALDIYSYKA